MTEGRTPDEAGGHDGPGGPVEAARRWAQLVVAGRLDEAWPLTDVDFRLALTRAWCIANRRHPLFEDLNVEALARDLATAGPESAYWAFFEDTQVGELRHAWGDISRWRVASPPSPAGAHEEHVVFVPPAARPLLPEPDAPPTEEHVVAVRSTPTGWLVTGLPPIA